LTAGVFCLQAAPDMSGAFWLLYSDFCAALFIWAVDRWRAERRCSVGSPDSPVNYSRARLLNSREWLVWLCPGLVHRTVSGAPLFSTLSSLAPNEFKSPTKFFLGLYWTLCTWDKWHLDKLVSLHGLCWTSTTKIDYRKWLGPFPFQSVTYLSIGGKKYCLVIVGDYSRFAWVFFVHDKSEVQGKIKPLSQEHKRNLIYT
jgi:hypothetical protein